MPGEHAYLSPSASERWLQCPASVRLTADMPGEESSYAAEGTCAHELGEIKLRFAIAEISAADQKARLAKWRKKWDVTDRQFFEMDHYTDLYVELIEERAKLYDNTQVLVEQRLNTGVPQCFGTGDAVLVSPFHVEVVDLKYGAGVAVEATGNSQLRLYLCGALDTYGDVLGDTELVRATVYQPRIGDGHAHHEELTPIELRQWRSSILPIAEEALGEGARFGPSESACRWCPASGRCRAQTAAVFAEVEQAPNLLSDDELAAEYGRLGAIKDWVAAVEAQAFKRAHDDGQKLPGYKIVLSGGKRSIRDSALQALLDLGYAQDDVADVKVRGIGVLEALMGKKEFATKLADHINPPVGKPALVPDDDPRPALDREAEAAKVFADTEDLL